MANQDPYSLEARQAQYARQQKQNAEEDRLRQQRMAEGQRVWEQSQYEKQQAEQAKKAASDAQIIASEEAVNRYYKESGHGAELSRMQREHPERYAAVRRKAVEMGVLLR